MIEKIPADEVRALRKSTGMTRKQFCEYFEIPYSTEEKWEQDTTPIPPYLFRLMQYKVEIEKLYKQGK